MNTPEFKVGDRVRVKMGDPGDWIDPKLDRRVQQRIPATVHSVIGTALHPSQRSYVLIFDPVGRMKIFRETIRGTYLEPAP